MQILDERTLTTIIEARTPSEVPDVSLSGTEVIELIKTTEQWPARADGVKIEENLIPAFIDVENAYSARQVYAMFRVYSELIYALDRFAAAGTAVHNPMMEACRYVKEVKRVTELLPPEFKKYRSQAFASLEEWSKYITNWDEMNWIWEAMGNGFAKGQQSSFQTR